MRTTKLVPFSSFLIILLLVSPVLAQEQNVIINFDINQRKFLDNYVVGDSFSYNISLRNVGNATFNDTFNVTVSDPTGVPIDSRLFHLILEPNITKIITPKGGKENETAAILFKIQGPYVISIESYNFTVNFREDTRVFLDDVRYYDTYIRQPKKFEFPFDVMPKWQYDLWKDSQKENENILQSTESLKGSTDNLYKSSEETSNLTESLKNYTVALFILTFVMVMITLIDSKNLDKRTRALFFIILIGVLLMASMNLFSIS